MSWARALGEFGVTIMFAGNVQGHTQTLPLAVHGEFQAGNPDTSMAAAILALAAFRVLMAVRITHWGRVARATSSANSSDVPLGPPPDRGHPRRCLDGPSRTGSTAQRHRPSSEEHPFCCPGS